MGLFGIASQQAFADSNDYTKYVDPFVGNADNGHTFPGACRPFGMIQTSPVTGGVGWRCHEELYGILGCADAAKTHNRNLHSLSHLPNHAHGNWLDSRTTQSTC